MNSLGLRELRHVSLRCSSLDEAEDFYTNAWGLELVERSIDRLWLRGTGPEHHILQFVESDNLGQEHVAFALATPEDVDSAAKHLVNMGVDLISEPHRSDDLGGGYRLTFNDPEGRCIMLAALLEAVAPRSEISNQPIQLSHVVFNTVDINAAVEFWTQVVGLRVSDWSENQMAFLRCNNRHHSVAFNQAEWTSVNHIAYDFRDTDAFFQRLGVLRHLGFVPIWGPGRHGPGNNAFAYFGDPVGYVPEVTTGLIDVEESNWVPRVWQRVPEQSDLWGTAGPPSDDARARMAGSPEPTVRSAGGT